MQLSSDAMNKIKARGQYYITFDDISEESHIELLCVLNLESNDSRKTIKEKIHGAGGTLHALAGNICSVHIVGRDLQQFLDLPLVRRVDFGSDLYPEDI